MPKPGSIADKIKQADVSTTGFKKRKEPLWKGPESKDEELGGITFSMLSRFLGCRERFRIQYIEGLRPTKTFNHKIEYGQMWHTCEEALAKITEPSNKPYNPPSWCPAISGALKDYCQGLVHIYPTQAEQIDHWYRVCKVQFPEYVKFWAKNKDVKNRTQLMQEQVFHIPYTLPSGRVVWFRGKWDAVDLIGSGKDAGIYVQENKTKGTINEQQLLRQLTFDLQTMIYVIALVEDQKLDSMSSQLGAAEDSSNRCRSVPIAGVRYNVVRRPLSGGTGTIRQHKPSKSNPQGESKDEFYGRVAQYIIDEPQSYFMRWKVEVTQADIAKFRKECLDPILEQLCDWYEFITGDDRRRNKQIGREYNDVHYRHPYGLYNVLDEGGSSELDEYLTTGSTIGLTQVDELFSELKC